MAKRTLNKRTSSPSAPVDDFGPETFDTWEHDGVTYNKRDSIYIEGEDGLFQFWSYQVSAKNGKGIVNVWWVGRQFRSFYADRVLNPDQRKRKKDSVCKEHPSYGAVRRPRTDCGVCWAAFEAKQERKKHGTV